jgi:hypothetical protein
MAIVVPSASLELLRVDVLASLLSLGMVSGIPLRRIAFVRNRLTAWRMCSGDATEQRIPICMMS